MLNPIEKFNIILQFYIWKEIGITELWLTYWDPVKMDDLDDLDDFLHSSV